ncbi:C-X-C chemokine receptor type 5 [Xenentodon cancila]
MLQRPGIQIANRPPGPVKRFLVGVEPKTRLKRDFVDGVGPPRPAAGYQPRCAASAGATQITATSVQSDVEENVSEAEDHPEENPDCDSSSSDEDERSAELEDADNFTDSLFMCDDQEATLENFDSVVKPVLYGVIFLVGLVGNSLMTMVLLRRRHRLRVTEIYLLHLALADVMLLLTLPFEFAVSSVGWVFGEFLCMLAGVLKHLNYFGGSLLLALIGFDRYLAIVHAVPSMQSRRPRKVHLTCLFLWSIALLLSFPDAVFLSVKMERNSSKPECFYCRFDIHSHNWVLANRLLNHLCFFFSLAVMSYCYTALIITLCNSQKKQAKKGAIRLALLVTFVFCFCWLPFNIALVVQTMVDLDVIEHESCESQIRLNQAITMTQSLGISHCCLNPFLYAFVGVQFRNELIQLVCRLGCSRVCLPFLSYRAHSRPSISEGTTSNSINF